MRLELLLILGILFFCCWCAFIVARMNWSVALPAPQQPPQLASEQATRTGNLKSAWQMDAASQAGDEVDFARANGHHLADYPNNNNNNNTVWMSHANGHLFGRLAEASQPAARIQQPQARSVYLAGGQQGAWTVAGRPINPPTAGPQPIEPEADNEVEEEQPENPAEQEDSNNNHNNNDDVNNEIGDQPATQSDEQHQQNPEENNENDNNNNNNYDDGDDPDAPKQPPSREHQEQASERRSFSEDVADSNERDRDGNLVLTKRSHLINGKKVPQDSNGPRGGSTDQDDRFDEPEEEADEDSHDNNMRQVGSKDHKAKDKRELDREFDKVVSEIDRERDRRSKKKEKNNRKRPRANKRRRPEVATAASATKPTTASVGNSSTRHLVAPTKVISKRIMLEGGLRQGHKSAASLAQRTGSKVKPQVSRSASNKPGKHSAVIRPPALHEHRVQETLSAQQWDDNSPPNPGEQEEDEREQDLTGDGDLGGGDIVDDDEEARKLEELSQELLASNSPETTTASLSTVGPLDRRRRQVTSGPEIATNSSLPMNELAGATLSGKSASDLTPSAPTEAPTMSSSQTKNETLFRLVSQIKFNIKNDSISDEWNLAGRPMPVVVGSNNLTNQVQGEGADVLAGQDDISIEVLADPPRSANASIFNGAHYLAGQPVLQTTSAPPVAFSHQPQTTVGPFPQVQGSPLASGTYEEKAISTKKKKVNKKKKKSKGNMEKYKSAKAHKKKMKSKRKKAKTSKKRHKEKMKVSAKKKHFKGHSAGSKASKGIKADGADKGTNFYKDKGYKKKGFKRVYHKLESGDHKTYFDEFRDKDHKKKWKKFNDKSKYNNHKKWSAGDVKRLKEHKYNSAKGKSQKDANYKQMESSKYTKKGHKSKKQAKHLEDSEGMKKKKKKKKESD